MSGIIWNVRGFGNLATQRRALFLRRHHQLSFLAVLEPMVDLDCRYMALRMGFEEVVSNKSGKVWFFWESTIACKVLFDHDQFLHLELSSLLFPSSMIVTVVYAKCTRLERSVLWGSLEELRPEGDKLWLVGGDFNVISSMEEHSAGVLARPGAMEDFNNFIMLAGLVDAGFVGDRYTWTNNRVWKRLDRVLLSPSWSSLDFTVRVEHLSRAASDHCPLLVEFPGFQKPRASFRFQRMWVRHRDFMQTAEESMAAAEHAYDRDPTAQSRTHRSECQAHLFRVLDMEEDFWKQRAAIRWMGEGERNTKFFHSTVQKKRAELLTGETVDSTAVDADLIPTLVSTEDNLMLAALPSAEEVKQVVWSMCQDSAAGPDGFSVAFYRACWEIVGEDVLQAVLDFFEGQSFHGDSAQRWRDFRPISLCNVSYKIISKLMAQRMASVLGKVISPAQSGFVPGRLISDNILMAQELDHKLNYHIRGGNLILKLDMAKAYDRVQRGVVFRVMAAFGFSEAVIVFIRRCVTSSWFSILVNGQLSGFFRSQRGLRQGDPISPSLFILAAELLSRGIEALFAAYPGMAYATGCDMRVSHLAYADDVVIFLNGSLDCVRRGKEFLDRYEAQSGQAINAEKSSFFPSRCISDRRRQQIAAVTGFGLGERPMLYLGVPIISGNKRTVHLAPLLAKIQRKFQGDPASFGGPEEAGGGRSRREGWGSDGCQRSNASPSWRRMIQTRAVAERQIGWIIGQGHLSFWHDRWQLESGDTSEGTALISGGGGDRGSAEARGGGCYAVATHQRWEIYYEVCLGGLQDCAPEGGCSDSDLEQTPPPHHFRVHLEWSHGSICSMGARWQERSGVLWTFIWGWQLEGDGEMEGSHSLEQHWFGEEDHPHFDLLVPVDGQERLQAQGAEARGTEDYQADHTVLEGRDGIWYHQAQALEGSYLGSPGYGDSGEDTDIAHGESSYGAIVRDHSGQVVVARQGVLGEGSNIRAELMAILRGLELCVDRQLSQIWLESDSLVALHIIRSSGISWEFREEILRIRRLVRQHGVRCTHIYREGNAAADFLANQAYQVEGERVMEGQEIVGLLLGICRMDRLGLPYIRSSCKPG
ncbi:hypothetical protein ZIOFF_049593 [Zingiber officinale]|uniref:Reverse transcriptase domain-containing protein n=1 Tax=Zingiber officinale TaxID=94328 RepID=A0A8J5FHU5_ZINOF|nr:hypothetical protein ZIOFF_049593 [Zingiber officinale]